MKLKLDENLGRLAAELLSGAGHDVETVPSQSLHSASDPVLPSGTRRRYGPGFFAVSS